MADIVVNPSFPQASRKDLKGGFVHSLDETLLFIHGVSEVHVSLLNTSTFGEIIPATVPCTSCLQPG